MLALTGPGLCQSTAQFESIFGGPWSDGARSIITLSDGGFALGGWKTREDDSDRKEGWVIRVDERGRYRWDLPLPLTGQEGVLAMSPALDGSIFIISDTDDGPRSNTRLTKVSLSGVIEWTKTYGGRGRDRVMAIRPTLDGGLVMAGRTTTGTQGHEDGWVVKLDNRFDVQWFRTLGGPQPDAFLDIAVSLDGSFIAVGFLTDDADDARGWAIKLDPLGRSLWQETYTLSDRTHLQSVYPLLTGHFVFAAKLDQEPDAVSAAAVGAIDEQGNMIWKRVLNSENALSLNDLIQTSEGLMVAVGTDQSEDQRHGLTVVFTPSGSSATLIRHSANKQVQASSITNTSFGSYAMAGTAFNQEKINEDVWLLISRDIIQMDSTSQESGQ